MNKNNNLVIPLSIIIAGFLIAGAIVFSNKSQKTNDTNPTTQVSPTKTEIKFEADVSFWFLNKNKIYHE